MHLLSGTRARVNTHIEATLNHPFPAQVFIAMTAALGGPLFRHVRRARGASAEGGGLDCAAAVYYACNVADALGHCHEWGVVHRDVKASNRAGNG